jgi:prepilin peptidase CpaA
MILLLCFPASVLPDSPASVLPGNLASVLPGSPASVVYWAELGREEMGLPNEVFAGLLTVFVVAVSIFDIRERRIPNLIVFPAALIGLTLNLVLRGWDGLGFGLKGLAAGFALLFIPYLVGGMKAGDVKFLAAIGAFLGAIDVVRAILATLLCYPLLAAFAVIKERKFKLTWLRFRRVLFNFLGFFITGLKLYAIRLEARDDKNLPSVTTPFGLAVAVGALIAVYTNFLR